MKIAYFDCYAGISGDMCLAALADAGLDREAWAAEMAGLALDGYRVVWGEVHSGGLHAAQVRVLLTDEGGEHLADEEFTDEADAAAPIPTHHHHETPSRGLADIQALLAASSLRPRVRARAEQVFRRLAEAEGRVHGQPPEAVHFHEVGAVDAIVDIVGVVTALEVLGVEQVWASPLPMGSGQVRSAHGVLPVPAPATLELLRGVPIYGGERTGELVTPTGAALLVGLGATFGALPPLRVQAVGYGAGTRRAAAPNLLRVVLGAAEVTSSSAASTASSSAPRDPYPEQHAAPPDGRGLHTAAATVIETSLDDMPPPLFARVSERLLAAGALDVALLAAQMKKGRPGVILQVLAAPDTVDDLLTIIFAESTALGARTYAVTKHMLRRSFIQVTTPWGPVAVKLGWQGARLVNLAPEYADCYRLAVAHNVPLKMVVTAALAAAAPQTGYNPGE
jgi:uncharacterized protein (TIGR00299 family) protein